MKRRSFVFVCFVLSVVVALCAFSACSDDGGTKKSEKKITSITAEVPETDFIIGQIDYSVISLIVKYDDGTSETVALTESMVSSSDRSKLREGAKPGVYRIRVAYGGVSTAIDMKLVSPTVSYYTLTVIGGYVSAENGATIVSPVIPDDNVGFSKQYAAGTTLTLTWKTLEDRHFDRWTKDNVEIAGESIINVTLTADAEYRAYSSSVYNTVSFVAGFDDLSVKSKTTNILNEQDIETLSKDGYVFLGWTTDAIDEEAARSGYKKNRVTFPYSVTRDATLYGVWAPIGITYTDIGEGYAVSAFDGEVTELVIPETYDGKPVVKINSEAFTSEASKNIQKITLPASLQTVEKGAFRYCKQLKNIFVAAGSENFVSDDGVLYGKGKKILYSYPAAKITATYVIPSDVSEIVAYAFYDAAIGEIILCSDVKKIGGRAFDGETISGVDFYDVNSSDLDIADDIFNDNIAQICVTESKKSVFVTASKAFNEYSEKIVTDRSDLYEIGSYSTIEPDGRTAETVYRVIENENFDLSDATAEILTTTRDIERYTLQIYTQDKARYTITSLGKSSFAACANLTDFRIPAGSKLERVCDGAFDGTPWADSLDNDAIIANEIYYKYLGNEETVVFGSTRIDKIAEGAFAGKTKLKYLDVTANATLKTIAAYAFCDCYDFRGFKSKNNEAGNGLYLKKEVEKIGAYAFYGTKITGVTIQPEDSTTIHKLKEIGEYAFGECDLIEFVQIPAATATIAYTAFVGCTANKEFSVDDGNKVFKSYDGVLYAKNEDGYTLYCYPAGKIYGEFDPSVTTERNYASSIDKDERKFAVASDGTQTQKQEVGSIYFNGAQRDLYLSIFVDDYSKISNGHDNVLLYGEEQQRTLTETTEIVNGIPDGEKLFSTIDDNGREAYLLYDHEKANYYYPTSLKITEFAPYALKDANIGALVIPEDTKEIPSTAIDVRGLSYVLFKGEPKNTFKEIFPNAEPEYVVIPESVMLEANREGFYQSEAIKNRKDRKVAPYKFFYEYVTDGEYEDKSVLYGYNAEDKTISVMRTSRSEEEIAVPKEFYVKNYTDGSTADLIVSAKKRVTGYAFFGGNLKKVELRGINQLCDNAFTEAYEMTTLDLTDDFISDIGSNVFGSKFGDGLFIYDLHNGADLYYGYENWRKGLSVFTYGENNDKKAARYLISSKDGAFAVIVFEYSDGTKVYVDDLLYGNVSVADLSDKIDKPGYEITLFANEDQIIDASESYTVEYNQILICGLTPKQYTVYVYASENVEFGADFEYVSKDETGLARYMTTVTYDERYWFEPSSLTGYAFYRFKNNDKKIEASGTWIYDEDEAELYLVQGYKLTLKNGETELGAQFVFYGEKFDLGVPEKAEGKSFVGWEIKIGDETKTITDKDGNSLDVWTETGSADYEVYAKWE